MQMGSQFTCYYGGYLKADRKAGRMSHRQYIHLFNIDQEAGKNRNDYLLGHISL